MLNDCSNEMQEIITILSKAIKAIKDGTFLHVVIASSDKNGGSPSITKTNIHYYWIKCQLNKIVYYEYTMKMFTSKQKSSNVIYIFLNFMFLIWRKYVAHLLRSVTMTSLSNDVPSQNHCKIVNIKLMKYIKHWIRLRYKSNN